MIENSFSSVSLRRLRNWNEIRTHAGTNTFLFLFGYCSSIFRALFFCVLRNNGVKCEGKPQSLAGIGFVDLDECAFSFKTLKLLMVKPLCNAVYTLVALNQFFFI